ncbi:hypothetical protein LguiA_003624 [Lonicera macranthoides]
MVVGNSPKNQNFIGSSPTPTGAPNSIMPGHRQPLVHINHGASPSMPPTPTMRRQHQRSDHASTSGTKPIPVCNLSFCYECFYFAVVDDSIFQLLVSFVEESYCSATTLLQCYFINCNCHNATCAQCDLYRNNIHLSSENIFS